MVFQAAIDDCVGSSYWYNYMYGPFQRAQQYYYYWSSVDDFFVDDFYADDILYSDYYFYYDLYIDAYYYNNNYNDYYPYGYYYYYWYDDAYYFDDDWVLPNWGVWTCDNMDVSSNSNNGSAPLGAGAIVGIVIGCITFVVLLTAAVAYGTGILLFPRHYFATSSTTQISDGDAIFGMKTDNSSASVSPPYVSQLVESNM
jgi:hypothetical protein